LTRLDLDFIYSFGLGIRRFYQFAGAVPANVTSALVITADLIAESHHESLATDRYRAPHLIRLFYRAV
jgi:hypothetical protein